MEKRYSKRGIVILCSLVYFVSYFSRKDFAAVMAAMLEASVLDKETAGLIGTMLFAFYGVGQLLSGYLGDRMKPKHLLMLGIATTAVCNLVFPLVGSGGWLIAIWGLNGLAQAMLWPPIVRILAEHLDHEQYATANLVVTTAAHVATILLYLYVPLCLKIATWQTVFYSAAILAAAALAVFVIALRFVLPEEESPAVKRAPRATATPRREGVLATVKRTGLLPIFACIVTCGFLRDGIESWLPTLYSEAFGRDASESILISVALPVFAILSITLVKLLHKGPTFNNEPRGAAIFFASAAVLCLPLFLMIESQATVSRIVCLVLASLVCGAMHGINFLLISCVPGRYARTGCVSTISGLCNAFIYVGAAASMYGIALVAEHLGWQATVLSWIGVAVLGGALVLLGLKKFSEFIREEN